MEELVPQAAERLDGLRLDGDAWCSLAQRLRASEKGTEAKN